ncbi:DUF3099 domain-containing protein [Kineosporia sp. J2-2]|uniref:DUF3099 domain-containing protein n=1 Tax=Kineosporia corallincola TaxID=2835133 RepID=A0ABS5TPZ9_9ACTN|nr:DUF6343 family protein [Kineosporia corallincola]MBT0772123.1 DUF3099 domain-containing protein [Kineosporia corallincola]
MRTGDEPDTARSALRLRLGLAIFGLLFSVLAAGLLAGRVALPVVLMFAAVGLVAVVDVAVVLRHLRQGAHFQPGPQVPPYRPLEPPPRPSRGHRPVDEDTRIRRYLVIMATCLVLITLAWTWVRTYSTTASVVMSIVAAVLPPVAAVVANLGADMPDQGSDGAGTGRRPRRPPDGGLEN